MRLAPSAVLTSIVLLAPAAALASDGGQASVNPGTVGQPQRKPMADDIYLGDGLYMCARMDCSAPGGPPRRNIVGVPNGDLTLNANGDIVGVGGPANGQVLVQYDGGTGYDGAAAPPPD